MKIRKLGKKNKRRVVNKRRAFQVFCSEKTGKIYFSNFLMLNLINVWPFNKLVGPGKKSKINKRRAYVYSGL